MIHHGFDGRFVTISLCHERQVILFSEATSEKNAVVMLYKTRPEDTPASDKMFKVSFDVYPLIDIVGRPVGLKLRNQLLEELLVFRSFHHAHCPKNLTSP